MLLKAVLAGCERLASLLYQYACQSSAQYTRQEAMDGPGKDSDNVRVRETVYSKCKQSADRPAAALPRRSLLQQD